MHKYNVEYYELRTYRCEVEAGSEEEALEIARNLPPIEKECEEDNSVDFCGTVASAELIED